MKRKKGTLSRFTSCVVLFIIIACSIIALLAFKVFPAALEVMGRTFYDNGASHFEMGEYQDAIHNFEIAAILLKYAGNDEGISSSLWYLSLCYEQLQNYAEAITWASESMAICERINDSDCVAIDLEVLANIEYDRGNYQGALYYHAQALYTYLGSGNLDGIGVTYHNIGVVYSKMGNTDLAISNFKQAAVAYAKGEDRFQELGEYEKIGSEYESSGNYSLAKFYYEKQLSVVEQYGFDGVESRTLINLGLLYRRIGQYEKALDYYQTAVKFDHEHHLYHPQAEAQTDLIFSDLYLNWNKLDLAEQYANKSLDLAQQNGLIFEETGALGNLGSIAASSGNYEEALNYHLRALTIAQEYEDNYSAALASYNIGNDYVILGDQLTSGRYYKESSNFLDAYDKKGMQFAAEPVQTDVLAPNLLLSLGDVYAIQGKYTEALESYNKALASYTQKNNQVLIITTLINIGTIYEKLGDYDSASHSLANAAEMEPVDLTNQTNLILLQGEIEFDRGNLDSSIDYFEQALSIVERSGDQRLLATVLFKYAELLKAQGKNQDAIDFFRRGLDLENSFLRSLGVSEFQGAYNASLSPYYEELFGLLWQAGDYEMAFQYSEQARARAFLDELKKGPINLESGLAGDLLSREQTLKTELLGLNQQLNIMSSLPVSQQDQGAITEVKSQLTEKENEYSQLLVQLKLQSPQVTSLVSVDVLSITEVQSYLDAKTTLMEYFITEDSLYIFVVTHNTFDVSRVDVSRTELTETISHLRSFPDLNDPNPMELQQLYTWLIAPIRSKIKSENIAIVPHGVLHYVPFSALTKEQSYLIQDYGLFTLPSASSLQFIPKEGIRQPTSILLLGNPATADTVSPLVFAEQEVKNIARIYPSSKLYLRSVATETVFTQEAISSDILHLAAHSELNSGNPLFSAILLAPDDQNDGRLEVFEIYGLDLSKNTDLVILSGCQTQIGEINPGDEVIGLTRAFLYAGSPSVVSSLWEVDDASTAMLMESFYVHLSAGMTKVEALRQAQLDVQKKYPSPYYWASFVLTGDP